MVVSPVPADEGEVTMFSCEKVLEGIWDYLDKELCGDSLAGIKKHLELCRTCYSRLEFERLLRDHLRNRTNHCCPERLKKRIQDIVELY